mgnify:CR=1 FL=1
MCNLLVAIKSTVRHRFLKRIESSTFVPSMRVGPQKRSKNPIPFKKFNILEPRAPKNNLPLQRGYTACVSHYEEVITDSITTMDV